MKWLSDMWNWLRHTLRYRPDGPKPKPRKKGRKRVASKKKK